MTCTSSKTYLDHLVVACWLAEVVEAFPHPINSSTTPRPTTPQRAGQKRLQSRYPSQSPVKRRRPLRSISANMPPESQESLRRSPRKKEEVRRHDDVEGVRAQEHTTPLRQRRTSQGNKVVRKAEEAVSEEKGNELWQEEVLDATPRATRPQKTSGNHIFRSNLPQDMRIPELLPHQGLPSYSRALSTRTSSKSSATSSAAESDRSSATGNRGTSPTRNSIKNSATLRRFEKPVEFNQLRKEQWKDYEHITNVCHDLEGLILEYFVRSCKEDLGQQEPHKAFANVEDSRGRFWKQYELACAQEIQKQAQRLESDYSAEPGWNDEVHSAILQLAFDPRVWAPQHAPNGWIGVEHHNISTAQISQPFRPVSASASLFKTKIVDYTCNIIPDGATKAAITRFVNAQHEISPELATVNQTPYPPIAEIPTLVPIESKNSQKSEDTARGQLGTWVSAAHMRLAAFLQDDKNDNNAPRPRIIPLPLILISGHVWDLYWAMDEGDRIRILRYEKSIGDTKSVGDVFMLLACLRRLAEWGLTVLGPWWAGTVLGL